MNSKEENKVISDIEEINARVLERIELGLLEVPLLEVQLQFYRGPQQRQEVKGLSEFVGSRPQGKSLLQGSKHKLIVERIQEEHKGLALKREQYSLRLAQEAEQQKEAEALREQQCQQMEREQRRRRAELGLQQIQEVGEARKEQLAKADAKLKELKEQQPLHLRLEQQYLSSVQAEKEKEKAVIEDIKSKVRAPLDFEGLKEHERFFLKMRREVSQLHRSELKQKLESARMYRPDFKLKVSELVREERRRLKAEEEERMQEVKERAKKVEKYKEYVLQNHMPVVTRKSVDLSSPATSQSSVRRTSTSHYELGKRYLEEIKELNSRVIRLAKTPPQEPIRRSQSERKNYLQRHKEVELEKLKARRLDRIIADCEGGERRERVEQLVSELERRDVLLERKGSLGGGGLAQDYVESISRKLQALQRL